MLFSDQEIDNFLVQWLSELDTFVLSCHNGYLSFVTSYIVSFSYSGNGNLISFKQTIPHTQR